MAKQRVEISTKIDSNEMLELWHIAKRMLFETPPKPSEEQLSEFSEAVYRDLKDRKLYFARVNGRLAGMMGLERNRHRQTLHIRQIAVAEKFDSRKGGRGGIGTVLTAAAMNVAEKENYRYFVYGSRTNKKLDLWEGKGNWELFLRKAKQRAILFAERIKHKSLLRMQRK